MERSKGERENTSKNRESKRKKDRLSLEIKSRTTEILSLKS